MSKALETSIEISGVLSPSLQAAIKNAVNNLEDMYEETLDAAGAAEKLAAEISAQESVLKKLEKGYADFVVSGEESTEEAQKLAQHIQDLSSELDENKDTLTKAHQAAEKLASGMDDTGDEANQLDDALEKAEESAERANEGFTVMKGVLANLVTKGIMLAVDGFKKLASASAEAYQEYDGGADTIIAKTGATGEAAADLQAVYKNVTQNVVGDFSDMGTAVGEINTRFGLTGDDLENLSTKFLKFSELNGTDVNSAVDSVQKSLAAFGLESSEAGSVLDTMNKVGQDTGISMETLSDLVMENASSFSQMGLDIHQSAAFLGDIEKSGVTTKVAMTGLAKASQFAAEEGEPLTKVLEETTEQMKNAGSDTEALQIAYDVFGKKAGAKIFEACKNGTLSFDKLSEAMENNAGSIDETYEATQDGLDKIKLFYQTFKAKIGDAIATFLDDHKDDIVKGIENITKAGEVLREKLPYIGIALGAVGATIAAMKWGKIVGGVSKAISAFKGIGTALSAVPGPALAIIGVVAALAAGFAYLWKNNEGFREQMSGIWEQLQGTFSQLGTTLSGLLQQIMPLLSSLGSTLLTSFASLMEALLPVLAQIVSEVLILAVDLLNQLLPIFLQFCQMVLPVVVDLLNQLLPVILQVIQMVLPVLLQLIQSLLPVVLQICQMVLPLVVDLLNQLLPVAVQIISAVLPILVEILNLLMPILSMILSLLQPILDLFIALLMPILDLIMSAINPLISILGTLISAALQPVMNTITVLSEVITSVLGAAIQTLQPIIQGLQKYFQGLIDFITGIFSGNWSQAWDGIVQAFSGIWQSLVGIVKAPINGVIGLINGAIGALNKISVKIPDWVPVVGGQNFGINIPKIPLLASGGFTDGVSIAGEEAMEAVISFDPAYRDKNIGIWEKAGQLLGVLGNDSQSQSLTSKAGELLTLDDFSLGSLANNSSVVIYYDFSNFVWSPHVQAGDGEDEDGFMARLKAHEAEFFDWLEEFIEMREVAQYA